MGTDSNKNTKVKYKVGDVVKVIDPTFVVRVGYPFTPAMAYAELNTSTNRQLLIDMMHEVGVDPYYNTHRGEVMTQPVHNMLDKLSYELVRTRNFGGPDRTLHTQKFPDMKDCYFRVEYLKRTVTGTRVSGTWCGEEWEPATMENAKHHQLIGLWLPISGDHMHVFKDYPGTWWIQKENVILDDRS